MKIKMIALLVLAVGLQGQVFEPSNVRRCKLPDPYSWDMSITDLKLLMSLTGRIDTTYQSNKLNSAGSVTTTVHFDEDTYSYDFMFIDTSLRAVIVVQRLTRIAAYYIYDSYRKIAKLTTDDVLESSEKTATYRSNCNPNYVRYQLDLHDWGILFMFTRTSR